jgi:hypothetical protein
MSIRTYHAQKQNPPSEMNLEDVFFVNRLCLTCHYQNVLLNVNENSAEILASSIWQVTNEVRA